MEQNKEEYLTDLSAVAVLNQVLQEISHDIEQWLEDSITLK
ncbi:MAG: hypothetical protein P8M34_04260 [Saprospiraceae bacterium]|nr:hypothetical protein [Saprospiraceae bacterium]